MRASASGMILRLGRKLKLPLGKAPKTKKKRPSGEKKSEGGVKGPLPNAKAGGLKKGVFGKPGSQKKKGPLGGEKRGANPGV